MTLIERDSDDAPQLLPCDLPWLSHHVLVLTARAVDAMRSVLQPWGQLLDLDLDLGLTVFSPARRDVLVESESDIVRVPPFDTIIDIRRPAFRRGTVPEGAVFKPGQQRSPYIYFEGSVVDAIEAAGLRGTRFEPVEVIWC